MPAHPGTAVIGSRSGRERALNLPASPIRGWPPQDFLPEYRWGDFTPSRPFRMPPFFGPCETRNSALVVSSAPLRKSRPRPRLPPFPSQDALRGPGRKSPGSRVCVWVCVWKRRAAGDGRWGFPSEASPVSLPSPTEPLREGSRPGPSPGREDVASVHQGRWIQTTQVQSVPQDLRLV